MQHQEQNRELLFCNIILKSDLVSLTNNQNADSVISGGFVIVEYLDFGSAMALIHVVNRCVILWM